MERHHIVPKCLGGSNDESNLVYLTPEEHFVAHQLLVKMNPGHRGLIYAVHQMTRATDYVVRNNKLYGWVRKLMKIKRGPFSEQTKQRLSATRKRLFKEGKLKPNITHHTDETRKLMSEMKSGEKHPFYGTKRPEHSEHMKTAMIGVNTWAKGTQWIHDPISQKSKMIPNDLPIPTGYIAGRPFKRRAKRKVKHGVVA